MDITLKKIELIEWLTRLQDEKLIQKIEALRKGSAKDAYVTRTPKTKDQLQEKLIRSELDIKSGRVHSHKEVEKIFKAKFSK